MSTPICDFVRGYCESVLLRLHMPGHKGRGELGCEALDITEVPGADDLACPEGVILESEENTTELFGSRHSFYCTGGSSQCVKAMLHLAYLFRPEGTGNCILAARNAHKSFLHGCALLGLEPRWLYPEAGTPLCSCPVSPAALERALQTSERPFAVYITSPDYLGGVQDIAALAEVCHRHGLPLLVDNAHGAYLKFLEPSRHPLDLGADMCCDSAHKTLPVLTGGAYLHVSERAQAAFEAEARHSLAVFGSSSPSYLILQSLDLCADRLDKDYPALIRATERKVAELARELALQPPEGDPLKLAIPSCDFGCTGFELASCLRDWRTVAEYADEDWLVLMFSPGLGEGAFEHVRRAMPLRRPGSRKLRSLPEPGECLLSPREALLARRESVPVSESAGRVCAEAAVSCPPAIPVAVRGERITPEAAQLMEELGIGSVSVVQGLE